MKFLTIGETVFVSRPELNKTDVYTVMEHGSLQMPKRLSLDYQATIKAALDDLDIEVENNA